MIFLAIFARLRSKIVPKLGKKGAAPKKGLKSKALSCYFQGTLGLPQKGRPCSTRPK
jgi:hypothetical protein